MKRKKVVPKARGQESFDLGYVVWEDANSDTRTLHEVSHAPMPLMSAGIIVRSDETGVTLVQDFSSEGTLREVKFIPRVNIRQETVAIPNVVARAPQWAMFPAPPKKRGRR